MSMSRFPVRLLIPLACCLAGLGAVPAAGQDVSIPYTTFELPNGLRLIVHEDRSLPIAAVNLWYHVGAGYEQPGRTGFAHLFEHIMFEGSVNVARGEFDDLLEAAGGHNNASVTSDRTNYWTNVPSNAVELALWLEADRMGGLLETMSQQKLDIQRDVVRNERRQSYENRPYQMFWLTAPEALYPAGHPYSWSGIGSMEDLAAASVEDVENFFRRYYVPNNAVLVVAGDVVAAEVRDVVERFFGWIPRGEPVTRPEATIPPIPQTRHLTLEDRITLPQVNLIWRSAPRYSRDDAALGALAAILADGKNSRLFRRLVYDEQTVQDVSGFNDSQLLSGDFYLRVTIREGVGLGEVEEAVLEEIARLASTPPPAEELQRVVNQIETGFVRALERVGGFGGKADRLNEYAYYTGDPGYAEQDLARFRALTPADIQRVAHDYLHNRNRVVINIVPEGGRDLAPGDQEATR
jgi:zinc protease